MDTIQAEERKQLFYKTNKEPTRKGVEEETKKLEDEFYCKDSKHLDVKTLSLN